MNVVVPPWAAARLPAVDDWARITSVSPRLKCTWASIPPGITYVPAASIVRAASSSTLPGWASSATWPSFTPTSSRAVASGETTWPPVISRSSMASPSSAARAPGRAQPARRRELLAPHPRDLLARRQPHPGPRPGVGQEAVEPADAPRPADDARVQPHRHHPRQLRALLVELVERLAAVGVELGASVE